MIAATPTRMTFDEIEHAQQKGGRCLVIYGNGTNDREEGTIIGFCLDITKNYQYVVTVKFDDGVVLHYFTHDIYQTETM